MRGTIAVFVVLVAGTMIAAVLDLLTRPRSGASHNGCNDLDLPSQRSAMGTEDAAPPTAAA